MSYRKTTLISRPIEAPYAGIEAALGSLWSDITSAAKKVAGGTVDTVTAGIKAKGGEEALAAQLAQQRAEAEAKAKGGISTTTMLIGGAVLAGVLVFAMRRK